MKGAVSNIVIIRYAIMNTETSTMPLESAQKLLPRAPLHLCALTLNRHYHPVASPDGTVFEASTITQLIHRTGLNPVTGQPLSPQSLVPLSFSIDPRTSLPRCPILFHAFNRRIKIVAVATTGNVYSFAAVHRHNLQPNNMIDLIDGTPFTLQHLIPLFDPQQHVWSTHSDPSLAPRPYSSTLPLRIHPATTIHPPSYSALSPHHHHLTTKRTFQQPIVPSPILKRPRLHPAVLPPPPNSQTPHFTKNSHSASAYFERKRAEEERKLVYKRVRKGRKGKGYVRVVTNIGHLNIELHCDKVPVTCDNFLSLAQSNYYDGLRWHRVVPGFIAQTGDPSGTGDGGDSFWGGFFKDEIRTSLVHQRAGVVSMANSGRDTNLSQWFITLDAAPHLDGAHTVFGKVVGGLFVLNKIETEAEMGHPLTVEKIEVLVNPIRQAREQLKKEAVPNNVHSLVDNSATTSKPQPSTSPPPSSNKPTTSAPHPTQQGSPPLSLPITTKPPAMQPQPQPSVSYPLPNRPLNPMQQHLPPARTLLSAVDISTKHN